MNTQRRAFTLIELLIVVGIIAILAAIAIPNMLEAQTRAKVVRGKTDMRTIATALETYRVDNNGYPTYHYVQNQKATTGYSFHVGGEIIAMNNSPKFDGLNPLTTPVAYLSAYPRDVFGSRMPNEAPEAGDYYYCNWDYAMEKAPNPVFENMQKLQGPWRIHSPGPDLGGPDSSSEGQTVYDPSNGSISAGDIVRTQRGGQM